MRKKKEKDEELDFELNDNEPTVLEQIENKFEPEGDILKKIVPAKWEALINILSFLTKDSDDAVIIDKSVVMHSLKTGGILKVKMHDIFDEELDLHISSPKKWTRLFKMLKNEDVFILNEENLFIVTNGQIRLFLPKQLSSVSSSLIFPSFEKSEVVSNMIFQKETRDKILNLSNNIQFIEFLIQDGIFKAINIPSTAIFVLPEFIKDPKIKDLNSNTADITLRCSSFLPFPAETHSFTIGRNKETSTYFAHTKCASQLVNIETYEVLDNISGVNSLW